MKNYEIMFIVKTTIGEDEVKATSKKFQDILTNEKAKIVDFNEMGQRELAYEIKDCKTGFYFVITCEASDKAVKEFDRLAAIDSNILRHLIINKEK
jgi:small subunit ribosomal protein S6